MTSPTDLRGRLEQALFVPLPGRGAQRRFCPELNYGRYFGAASNDSRQAAVLMLLYPDDAWYLLLMLRPSHLKDHGGQIGLPGGTIETGESIEQAAVRECQEELGIPSTDVDILGRLSAIFLYNSNFVVTPILGALAGLPDVVPNRSEVELVIRLPLAELVSEANVGIHTREKNGIKFSAPHIQWGEHCIWGATAILLGELIAVLNKSGSDLTNGRG